MSIFKYFWKVLLRKNLLTQDVENDFVAEVSTIGVTLHNADVAGLIEAEGSEIKYETVLNILDRADRIKREKLAAGNSIQDGVSHCSPRVHGAWIGSNAHFDPTKHSVTLDMSPSTEMREMLKQVGVEVIGVKDTFAYIGRVVDLAVGKADNRISLDEDMAIEGEKIKILPENDNALGVFFVSPGGGTIKVMHHLSQNDPRRLIVRVPYSLDPMDTYTLRIITRYSSSKTLLTDPRTIDYEFALGIRPEEDARTGG
jgi:hypothetical protein